MITYDEYHDHFEKNYKHIAKMFQDKLALSTEIFSKISYLCNRYALFRGFLRLGNNEHLDVILSTVYKGLSNLYAIIDLTTHGNIGASRILMRNTFEFLVLGKYILLCDDIYVRKKWDEIECVNLDRRIFCNMIYPEESKREAFIQWWQHLNQFTHATRASGQVEFEPEQLTNEINANFNFIYMFLDMLYHYVNRYLSTQYIKSYIQSLNRANNDHEDKTAEYDQEIKLLIKKKIFPSYTTACRKIIHFYVAAWRFDTSKLKLPAGSSAKGSTSHSEQILLNHERKTIKGLPRTRDELERHLDLFLKLYKSCHIAGISDAHKCSCLKYLKRLQTYLEKTQLPLLTDPSLCFGISISNTGIELTLERVNIWEEDKEHPSTMQELVLIEVKSDLITFEQFSNMYRVSTKTVQKWINHSRLRYAQKIGEQWYIPELCDKPRGFTPVDYTWTSLPKYMDEEHPYLHGYTQLSIYPSEENKNAYRCILHSSTRRRSKSIEISEKERIKLEHQLLHIGVSFSEPSIFCAPD